MISPPLLAWELLPSDERTLVAVSGGADSTALLLALKHAGRDIVAGHINHDLHELRHGECDRDEAWLRENCERWNVPLRVTRLELPRRFKGESAHVNEAVAREGRYQALAQLARETGCTRIATAHTAQDVLETLLLFWMRGATVRGYGGIAPLRRMDSGLWLVRPILGATRDQTRDFCVAMGQTWREDDSNLDPLFLRNRVRHELLPLLSNLASRDVNQLARQTARGSELFRDDEAFLESAARASLSAITLRIEQGEEGGPQLYVLDGIAWRELAPAMQRRTLLVAARDMGGAPDSEHLEAVRRRVMESGKRTVWQWPNRTTGVCGKQRMDCEWTGPGSGNRLRLRRVPKQDVS